MTDVRHLMDVRGRSESTFIDDVLPTASIHTLILLSPLGERLGVGAMQEMVFVLHPLT
jgi:hypothetical protein